MLLLFCGTQVAKGARHLTVKHVEIEKVSKALSKLLNSLERRRLFQILINKENHLHNLDVIIRVKDGNVTVSSRPKIQVTQKTMVRARTVLDGSV